MWIAIFLIFVLRYSFTTISSPASMEQTCCHCYSSVRNTAFMILGIFLKKLEWELHISMFCYELDSIKIFAESSFLLKPPYYKLRFYFFCRFVISILWHCEKTVCCVNKTSCCYCFLLDTVCYPLPWVALYWIYWLDLFT